MAVMRGNVGAPAAFPAPAGVVSPFPNQVGAAPPAQAPGQVIGPPVSAPAPNQPVYNPSPRPVNPNAPGGYVKPTFAQWFGQRYGGGFPGAPGGQGQGQHPLAQFLANWQGGQAQHPWGQWGGGLGGTGAGGASTLPAGDPRAQFLAMLRQWMGGFRGA